MLTAGHCAPAGGNFKTPSDTLIGTVPAGYENWRVNYGTTKFGSETIFRGDLALIKLAPGNSVAPRIWRGDENGNTTSVVRLVLGALVAGG